MPSAIDANRFAGDEIAVEQCMYGFGDLHLAAPPAEWCRLFDRFELVVCRLRRRDDWSWCDRVHEDVVGRELERERFGQRDHARFGDVVRQIAAISGTSALRHPVAEIDDAAAA